MTIKIKIILKHELGCYYEILSCFTYVLQVITGSQSQTVIMLSKMDFGRRDSLDRAAATAVEVRGCGAAEINGVYERDGTKDGVPKYSKRALGHPAVFSLQRYSMSAGGKQWYINIPHKDSDEDIDYYFVDVQDDAVTVPPASGWTVAHRGVAPAPTVILRFPRAASPSGSQPVVTPQASLQEETTTTTSITRSSGHTLPSHADLQRDVEDAAGAGAGPADGDGWEGNDDDDGDAAWGESSSDDDEGDDARGERRREVAARGLLPRRRRYARPRLRGDATSALPGCEGWREFTDALAAGGVDAHVDLPAIAVMGDTSSGKSSLLSSLGLVELPTADALTTRCPVRLRLRRAEARRATVRVVWKGDRAPPDADGGGEGDAPESFVPRTVTEERWEDVSGLIAEAQRHVLARAGGREVARDAQVCVELTGPQCEDLTLIDLPGIVRAAVGKGESDALARDVDALLDEYLGNERCVILAVHPSNVDFHNR